MSQSSAKIAKIEVNRSGSRFKAAGRQQVAAMSSPSKQIAADDYIFLLEDFQVAAPRYAVTSVVLDDTWTTEWNDRQSSDGSLPPIRLTGATLPSLLNVLDQGIFHIGLYGRSMRTAMEYQVPRLICY